jgi:hypothetical protein
LTVHKMLAGLLDFWTLIQLSTQTFSSLWIIEIISSVLFLIFKLFQHEWKKIWYLFFIRKLYQQDWNQVKIHFTVPKFFQVIDLWQTMSLVIRFLILNFFNMSKRRCDPFFPYVNFINETKKRCDLFVLCLNFIKKNEKSQDSF